MLYFGNIVPGDCSTDESWCETRQRCNVSWVGTGVRGQEPHRAADTSRTLGEVNTEAGDGPECFGSSPDGRLSRWRGTPFQNQLQKPQRGKHWIRWIKEISLKDRETKRNENKTDNPPPDTSWGGYVELSAVDAKRVREADGCRLAEGDMRRS